MPPRALLACSLVAASACVLAACPDEAPPACTTVDLSCRELYEPTFDKIYDRTLKDGCGSDRSACHSAEGKQGGLSMETPEIAYQGLLQAMRVKPGDAACSEMVVRVLGVGHDYQMPPGDPLMDGEQCAIAKWVQAGAPGPTTPATGAP